MGTDCNFYIMHSKAAMNIIILTVQISEGPNQ